MTLGLILGLRQPRVWAKFKLRVLTGLSEKAKKQHYAHLISKVSWFSKCKGHVPSNIFRVFEWPSSSQKSL